MMSNRPKISVAVITYNQQDTIAQTLDSILMQKGEFELELVVGEDCSTDNTWNICQDYASRYPDIVRLLPNTQNLGIMGNYARTVLACSGEFIGEIAGDDYYYDDHALEKQMSFLQQHPDYGFMTVNGYRYYVRRNKFVLGLAPTHPCPDGNVKSFYFSEHYSGGVYATPVGVMFRRSLLEHVDFDEIIRRRLPVEDYPLQAIYSQFTKFGWLPDPLVVYRIYKESATFLSFDSPKYLSYHKGLMDTRRYLNELFPQDACFTEAQMQDYEFYKEYQLYLHRLQYGKVKTLIEKHQPLIGGQPHFRQARRFSKTWLHFFLFSIYKRVVLLKDRQSRT